MKQPAFPGLRAETMETQTRRGRYQASIFHVELYPWIEMYTPL